MYSYNTDKNYIMRSFITYLFFSISLLLSAGPLVDLNCNDETMMCGMDMSREMSCCTDGVHNPAEMMDIHGLCCSLPRVVVSSYDEVVESLVTVQADKKIKKLIEHKWFNANYLSDLKTVDLVSVTPITTNLNGFKFNSMERLDFVCIYRL